jgi:hypothetical protein
MAAFIYPYYIGGRENTDVMITLLLFRSRWSGLGSTLHGLEIELAPTVRALLLELL